MVAHQHGRTCRRQPLGPDDREAEERAGYGPDGEAETAIEKAVQSARSRARDTPMPCPL